MPMKFSTISIACGLVASMLVGTLANAAAPAAVQEAVPAAKVVRSSPALDAVIAPDAKIEKIATGFMFTEGPLWHKGALWFSDLQGNKMYSLSPSGLKLMLDKSGGLPSIPAGTYRGSNGMVANKDGTLLMTQHGARRIVQLDDKMGVKVFLEKYQGTQLNSPNDMVYAQDGALYFTDPPYGFLDPLGAPDKDLDKDPGHGLKFNGVYRYKDGQLTTVITDLPRPNGLAFSPDGKTFYIANSENPSAFYKYDVRPDGTLVNKQLIADVTKEPGGGVPDGVKVDSQGNLWASGQGGFRIYSPKGQLLGQIILPEVAANVAWGGADGKTAYFTGSTSIYKLPLKIPGQKAVYGF